MHYYKFNVGDYRRDTSHLSPIEHYIYRSLIDWCYLDECEIPKKTQSVMRRLRLVTENEADLQNVLSDFFEETETGWKHSRIARDIELYHSKAEQNAKNGKKGGRPKKQSLNDYEKPKKTQSVNSVNQSESEKKPNQEPLTNNHKPIKKKSEPSADDLSIADQIFSDLRKINPSHKKPNRDSWANIIRLIRERDGKTAEEISQLWAWANSHHFWAANILSPQKLRDQWDKLTIQRAQDGKNQQTPTGTNGVSRHQGSSSATDRTRASANRKALERGEPPVFDERGEYIHYDPSGGTAPRPPLAAIK